MDNKLKSLVFSVSKKLLVSCSFYRLGMFVHTFSINVLTVNTLFLCIYFFKCSIYDGKHLKFTFNHDVTKKKHL